MRDVISREAALAAENFAEIFQNRFTIFSWCVTVK